MRSCSGNRMLTAPGLSCTELDTADLITSDDGELVPPEQVIRDPDHLNEFKEGWGDTADGYIPDNEDED
jgi:hypothetical protein